MKELPSEARNSVVLQADLFDLAKRDEGLSIAILARKTRIPEATLRDWKAGTPMPAWALFLLGKDGGVPDYLLSMVADPFDRHVGTNSGDPSDLDTAGLDAGEAAQAVQRARHPNSPGGVQIVPQERAQIIPLMRKSASSAQRAARG